MSKWNFSENLIKILQNSALQAQTYHSTTIGVEHIFLSMLEGNYPAIENFFAHKGINTKFLIESIGSKIYIHDDDYVPNIESSHIPLIKQSTNLLDIAAIKAKSLNAAQIEVEHLLMAIAWQDFNIPKVILNDNGISYNDIYNYFKDFSDAYLSPQDDTIRNQSDSDEYMDDEDTPDMPKRMERSRAKGAGVKKKKSQTPNLDAYGRDLNKAAEEGRLDPVVGREKELERIAQVLSRRKKNNPILIGEPGVGKSAIAEGLALKILQKQVPRILLNKRIIALDIASMLAGTKYRGQFEERMKNVLWEVESNPDIILFIDEIHTIVGAGNASGALDASNMFTFHFYQHEMNFIENILKSILNTNTIKSLIEDIYPNKIFYLFNCEKVFSNLKNYIEFFPIIDENFTSFTNKSTLKISLSGLPKKINIRKFKDNNNINKEYVKIYNDYLFQISRILNIARIIVLLLCEILGDFYEGYYYYSNNCKTDYQIFENIFQRKLSKEIFSKLFGNIFSISLPQAIYILNYHCYSCNYINFCFNLEYFDSKENALKIQIDNCSSRLSKFLENCGILNNEFMNMISDFNPFINIK